MCEIWTLYYLLHVVLFLCVAHTFWLIWHISEVVTYVTCRNDSSYVDSITSTKQCFACVKYEILVLHLPYQIAFITPDLDTITFLQHRIKDHRVKI